MTYVKKYANIAGIPFKMISICILMNIRVYRVGEPQSQGGRRFYSKKSKISILETSLAVVQSRSACLKLIISFCSEFMEISLCGTVVKFYKLALN